MRDLEEQVHRVWNPEVRPLVREAWRCYNAGAIRACIVATWAAVTTDLIDKIGQLADDGDGNAKEFRKRVEQAQTDGLTTQSVKTMQDIERDIPTKALEFELIDTITQRELARLQEDRHLCAHPSLRSLGEVYKPRPEVARAHLAVALEALLTQPPSQGQRVVMRFKKYLCDPLFSANPAYLTTTFLRQTRSAARRRIVDLAVKHAIRELPADPETSIDPVVLADRMAQCLHAFTDADRNLVSDRLAKSFDQLRGLHSDQLLRATARLGDLDVFWEQVDDPLANRLDELVTNVVSTGDESLSNWLVQVLALVRIDLVRQRLPHLEDAFKGLEVYNRAIVMARNPDEYFSHYVPQLLEEAPGWRLAEDVTRLAVIPYGHLLNVELLAQTLTNWAENNQCRQAYGMAQYAVDFYRATAHLGEAGREEWRRFLKSVRELEAEDSYHRYTELEAIIS